ncbi:MAG: tetraacyldisaccharide 4'-kinase [Dysgonamonadaceae bacterium]|jgi:tetraacyldisaccharide 4'-kinase|nr:tetraacyldisaccharide 4'-kinase [Dysgonamonadaceae bacterium]
MYQPLSNNRNVLLPLSWLYGIGVGFRNKLFEWGIRKSKRYPLPVICVGNITVGGTGKTPHIEYLVELLSVKYRVAVLSRGYMRKSKEMKFVETTSLVEEVGDEPLQIKQKYPDTLVVVDKNRNNAIEKILAMNEKTRPEVILLDDGFQHRSVSPSLSIVLMDYNRPIYEDELLPAGNLREPAENVHRASMVIVTKTNRQMQPIDFRIIANELDLFAYQPLFFTSFEYGDLEPVFPALGLEKIPLDNLLKKKVLLVAGIASPLPLVEKLEKKTYNLHTLFFPDHHHFLESDIENIRRQINAIENDDKIIVTTEKDAVRLRDSEWVDDKLKQRLYYIPIKINFVHKSEKISFNKKIYNHVRNHQSDSRLSQR